MTTASPPIGASELSAARLLDMKVEQFRELVRAGLLPNGREIAPGIVRWPVDDLRRILKGEASNGMSDVKW